MSFPAMPNPAAARLWNEETLDRFLAKPIQVLPGTRMTYSGVPEAKDRKDLIAYLKSADASGGCRKG